MNTPHRRRSCATYCFAPPHMPTTSGEDVDPFLRFLRSDRTCELDVSSKDPAPCPLRCSLSMLAGFSPRVILPADIANVILPKYSLSRQSGRWLRRGNMTFPFGGEAEHAFSK